MFLSLDLSLDALCEVEIKLIRKVVFGTPFKE